MTIDSEILEHSVDVNNIPDNPHDQDEPLQISNRRPPVEATLEEEGDEEGNGELTVGDPNILEQLAVSDTSCAQSESARRRITKGIMQATHELDQKLINEGEDTLEKADQLVAEAELKHLEARRELERAEIIRAEADDYFEKVIEKARLQVEQTRTIKAAAVIYQEKLLKAIKRGLPTRSSRIGRSRKLLGMMPVASRLTAEA